MIPLETNAPKSKADESAGAGGEARFLKLDVASEADWASAVSETISAYGQIDILVNSAGVYRSPGGGGWQAAGSGWHTKRVPLTTTTTPACRRPSTGCQTGVSSWPMKPLWSIWFRPPSYSYSM